MELELSMAHSEAHSPVRRSPLFVWGASLLGVVALALLMAGHFLSHGDAPEHAHHTPHMLSVIPFAALLLCIAVLPLIPATAHWWESNLHRFGVSIGLAGVTMTYFYLAFGRDQVVGSLEHAVLGEYIPFMVLLLSLFVISGGINVAGALRPTPLTNTAVLGIGAALASFIGTTGASMLLIRPLLQINRDRKHLVHTVIFFIFLVSNIGGCLLPIGDPPLFLGYLKGVPFAWTFRLAAEWGFATVILLALYFAWDLRIYKKREDACLIPPSDGGRKGLKVRGGLNFLWLGGVVLSVALIQEGKEIPLLGVEAFPFLREILMLAFMGLSIFYTEREVRQANQFNYHAIIEVAALFIGIFICMQAPIMILHDTGPAIAATLNQPWKYFWATGALSSFLDNAPTYVVFFETALKSGGGDANMVSLLGGQEIPEISLVAISLGAVFMGAMTYIGNGPNFMVKSIAEQSGVRMPSFFGYMLYSVGILVPVFIMISVLFLS